MTRSGPGLVLALAGLLAVGLPVPGVVGLLVPGLVPGGAPGELAAQAAAVRALPVEVEPGPPIQRPTPDRLATRRAALLDAIGSGVVVVTSASVRSIEGDYPQDSDFRQRNDFFYLTGLETPDSWLLLSASADGSRSEALFIPPRDPDEEQWTGRKASFEEAAAISGVERVASAGEFEAALPRALFRRGASPVVYAPLDRHLRGNAVIERLVFELPVEVRGLGGVLAPLRLVKDEHEVAMLRRAAEITAGALRAALRAAEPGMWEYELEAVIEANFRLGGAERVGFPSIIGSGANSVVLHYDKSRRRTERGDLVVMDVGAEYAYYSADITRTIPVSGRFTDRQRRIYELVLGAQEAALDAVAPGVTMGELSRIARGWLQERSGDACGERTCDAYFIHGLGHWLGMDVHDVGDYTTPLAPGMVLTIEPGIYLPEEGLGVRIEDDVLVTETGYELLSAGAPREPDAIEALMVADALP